MNPERLQIIREAAESLAATPRAARDATPEARPVFGGRTHVSAVVPTGWIERRRALIAGALAFLNTKGRGVQVIDRDARVRRYRLNGKTEPMLAEDVIRYAIAHGFDAETMSAGGNHGAG